MEVLSGGRKILIADDDREHLLMLAFILRKAGYQIVSAFDAKHALQLAVEQAPDLLLLDIHLGDEDGYAVQERLQKIEELAATPVIYITGDQSNWVQATTAALGAAAVIRKPFSREDLVAAIEKALTTTKAPVVAAACDTKRTPLPAAAFAEAYFG